MHILDTDRRHRCELYASWTKWRHVTVGFRTDSWKGGSTLIMATSPASLPTLMG